MSYVTQQQYHQLAARAPPPNWSGPWPPPVGSGPWPPGFPGPPPPPPGVPVNAQSWQRGQWVFNPAFRAHVAPQMPANFAQWAHFGFAQQGQQAQAQSYNPYKRVPKQPDPSYWSTELKDNGLGLENMHIRNESAELHAPNTPWTWAPRELEQPSSAREGLPPARRASDYASASTSSSTQPSTSQSNQPRDHRRQNSEPPDPARTTAASNSRTSSLSRHGSLDRRDGHGNHHHHKKEKEPDVFTAKRELQPTFSPSIVRTPEYYRTRPSSPTSNTRSATGSLRSIPETPTRGAPLRASATVPAISTSGLGGTGSMSNITNAASFTEEPAGLLSPLVGATPRVATLDQAMRREEERERYGSSSGTQQERERYGSSSSSQQHQERERDRDRDRYGSSSRAAETNSRQYSSSSSSSTVRPSDTQYSSSSSRPSDTQYSSSGTTARPSDSYSSSTARATDTHRPRTTSTSQPQYSSASSRDQKQSSSRAAEQQYSASRSTDQPKYSSSSSQQYSSSRSTEQPYSSSRATEQPYSGSRSSEVPYSSSRSTDQPKYSSSSQQYSSSRSAEQPKYTTGSHHHTVDAHYTGSSSRSADPPYTTGGARPITRHHSEPAVSPPPGIPARSPAQMQVSPGVRSIYSQRSDSSGSTSTSTSGSGAPIYSRPREAYSMSRPETRAQVQSYSQQSRAPTTQPQSYSQPETRSQAQTPSQSQMQQPPSSQSQSQRRRVRKGYWNRRGDYLTPDMYIVYAPHDRANPPDLKDYPAEGEGYLDHEGRFVPYDASRQELPESIPLRGQPPRIPYDRFVQYTYV